MKKKIKKSVLAYIRALLKKADQEISITAEEAKAKYGTDDKS